VEEANEVLGATNKEDLTEELADLFEVASALAKIAGISLEEIDTARKKKCASKGAFESRIYVDSVKMTEENIHIKYYRSRPDKYPEIIFEELSST
jgi:hypothetical protein